VIARRAFITLLGGAAAAWPATTRAQQPDRMRRVGMLMGFPGVVGEVRSKAFQQELESLGWSLGRNLALEVRWGEARAERNAEIVAEFIRLKVDVITTTSTPATIAAKQATSTIPIVFVGTADPVGTGLVSSLARPGSNVTGLSNLNRDIAGKRVALMREVLPELRQLGILVNRDNPAEMLEAREVEAAAGMARLAVTPLEIRQVHDITPVLDAFKGPGRAVTVVPGPLANGNALRINLSALAARLPTMHGERAQLEVGGLIAYGPDIAALFRRGADYVDKILRGARAGDIPVEQPIKFDLVINLITAKALGLTIPETLLARADEVIE
jgi:putative ABC transport system substrate-binding protein